jgi:hypothetical protein
MSERNVPLLKYAEKEDKTSLNSLKVLVAKQAEILAAIGDWLREADEIRKAIDEYLNLQLQLMEQGVTYSLDRIKWTRAEGPSGPYEYADKADNMGPAEYEDFQALLADLKDHGGRLSRQGYFMWLFSKGDRVGRKPSRRQQK